MRKVGFFIILLLVAAIAKVSTERIFQTQSAPRQSEPFTNITIEKLVEQINRDSPIQAAPDVFIVEAAILEASVSVKWQLRGVSRHDFDDGIIDFMLKQLQNTACDDPPFSQIIKAGFDVDYLLIGEDRNDIGQIRITPEYCQKLD